MKNERQDGDKVKRETYPTAAFSVRLSHIRWITKQAKALGVSKSEYVRGILDRDMESNKEAA